VTDGLAAFVEVENLWVKVGVGDDEHWLVDQVNLSIGRGETHCLVGESGCGKSLTALSLVGLVPPPLHAGFTRLRLGERSFTAAGKAQVALRGDSIGFVFQDPMSALNPLMNHGRQLVEGFLRHGRGTRSEAMEKAVYLLDRVGIDQPMRRMEQYPHQLSGGQRQRLMIAMALMCDPCLLIADEPTTAIDSTTQLEILELLEELQESFRLSVLFITHDLGVVARIAHDVSVMYSGQIVERGRAREVLTSPAHPYTRALLRSLPRLEREYHKVCPPAIPGSVPDPAEKILGCRFQSRCDFASAACREAKIALRLSDSGRHVRCVLNMGAEVNDEG